MEKNKYTEPLDYFPEEVRKKCGIGEYYTPEITFEEAYEIAKGLKSNIDACDEYENAYSFKWRAEPETIGGNGPCVVLKDSGRAINMTEYVNNYSTEHIREFDLPGTQIIS